MDVSNSNTNHTETMKKLTIQQAFAILQDRGIELSPRQPVVLDGRFVSQYMVDDKLMTGTEVLDLIAAS